MKAGTTILITIFLLSLIGCGGGNSANNNAAISPTPSLSSITITPGSASITNGGNQAFTATGKFSDGTSRDMTSSVQWTSGNNSVASIGANGMATGMGVGDTTIIAASGNIKASATIDVTSAGAALQAIAIAPANPSLPVNTSQQFTATGSYSDGSSRDITAIVGWGSSAPAVASISASGLVTAAAAGSATISASLGATAQTTVVTVTAPTISFITVTPVGRTLAINVNLQYVATATYSDGTSQDLISGVTWSSNATTVATVSTSGLVTTVGAGTATITASVPGFTDSATLTVVAAHLSSITISPATPSIALGTSQQFVAIGTFDDGSTQQLTALTWGSSSNTVATINSAGFATATGTGTTTISASIGAVSGSTVLTVTAASLVAIAVTPANSSMAVGTSQQMVATATFSDTTTQNITAQVGWTSSNPAVATINNSGVVGSLATGSTQISASFSGVTGSTGLTVSTAHLLSIAITPSNPRVQAGTSLQLHATGTFSDGSSGTNLIGLNWKSSKPNLASIRSTGIVHGKKSGFVTITATASGISGTTTLTVGTGSLVSIAITPSNPTVTLGTDPPFVATGSFSDSTTQDVTVITHWSSSVQSVATIANAPSVSGLATTTGKGTTAIGANTGGITNSTTLTVQ